MENGEAPVMSRDPRSIKTRLVYQDFAPEVAAFY
jgi:hypothetical protein